MTIEEAIKELIDASHREAKYGDTNNHYYEIMMRIEAFDMAIKVLEQQPCEDCISREAVLDCLTASALKKFDFILDARDKIKNLPSVTPKGVTITDFADRCRECGKIRRCADCYYNDGEVHAECVICDKAESEDIE